MRQITWPVLRGSKIIAYLEIPTLICLFTVLQIILGYDDDYIRGVGHFSVVLHQCTRLIITSKRQIRSPWNFVRISYVGLYSLGGATFPDYFAIFSNPVQWPRLSSPRFFRSIKLVLDLTKFRYIWLVLIGSWAGISMPSWQPHWPSYCSGVHPGCCDWAGRCNPGGPVTAIPGSGRP